VQKEVIDGIRMGKDVLQELNDQMKIEDVEKLMDDTADAIAYQKEVDAILHQNLSAEDDEAAQEELDRILEEVLYKRPPRTRSTYLSSAVARSCRPG